MSTPTADQIPAMEAEVAKLDKRIWRAMATIEKLVLMR
jgi:hypothetical protein